MGRIWERNHLRKWYMACLLVILLCFGVAGCGLQKSPDEGSQADDVGVTIQGDGQIVIKADREGGAYVAETITLPVPADAGVLRSVTEAGEIWGVTVDGEIFGNPAAGENASTDPAAGPLLTGEWDFGDVREVLLWQNQVWLLRVQKEGELEVRSLQGEVQGKIDGNGGTFEKIGGGLYALRRTGEMGARVSICKLDPEKMQITAELTKLPDDVRGVFTQGSDAENLYFYTSGAAYRYSFADKTFYELFAWTDAGVSGSDVSMIWKDVKGDIYVTNYGGNRKSCTKLTWKSEAELPKKKELRIAMLTLNSDGRIQEFVTKYNQSQEEWHVTIKKYADSINDDFDAAWTRLGADLLGDDPPDLICLANWNHTDDLAEQGYLMDLRPFLQKSDMLSEEDFYPEVLQASSYAGKLYTIPYQFTLRTMIVPAAQWKGEPGWTFSEMIRYCREHEEWRPFRMFGIMQMYILHDTLDYFWDAEKKEAHFDSQEFRELLEFMKECKEKENLVPTQDRPYNVELTDLRMLASYADLKEEHGDIVVMGYPSADGTPRTILEGSTEVSVLSTSKDPEGAWKFMEFYLSQAPFEEHPTPYSFWSNRNVLEKMIEKELALFGEDHEDFYDEDGNVTGTLYMKHNVDQECVDAFRNALACVKRTQTGNLQVRIIVGEEAQPYFEGQKTLDQVIDAIQSRVKLFLSE